MIRFSRPGPFVLGLTLAAAPFAAAGDRPTEAWALEFLQKNLGLRADELARLVDGQPVARTLENTGGREIAVVGAVALPGTPGGWGGDYAAIERLRQSSPDFIAMGRLSRPPLPEELHAIELDPRTASQLARCRPGKCAMNASAGDIERYRALDAEAEDEVAVREANAVFREVLRERLAAYQHSGDAALPVLANRKWKLTTADAPLLLLERKPSLAQVAPRIDARLRACASAGKAAPEDVFYWTREKVWRREVIAIHHAAFDDERVNGGRHRVVVEKLVWANHYLLGGLTATGILEDASGTYLYFLSRSETDNRSPFNFLQRALANRLLGGRLKRQMPGLREAMTPPRSARE